MSKLSVILPILAPTPFLRALAEFTIRTMRMHADDPGYELIVAEAAGDWFDPCHSEFGKGHGHSVLSRRSEYEDDPEWEADPLLRIDRYLNFTPPVGAIRETNAAIDAASGEFIVSTGTDIVVPQGWDTELLRVFEERSKDCGIACLSAFEPGATVGPNAPMDLVVEGMYSPFNMFRRGWRLDEAYQRIYQDSDLVMRMYEKGLRAFRSCRAHVHHFGSVTTKVIGKQVNHDLALAQDERLFYRRWGKSPLAMFGMIRAGGYGYGREHESWTTPIHLHYDANTPE